MLRSKWMQNLLRVLITLLGAGVGVTVMLGAVQIIRMSNQNAELPLRALVIGYTGTAATGMLIFFLCSRRILTWFTDKVGKGESMLDRLTLPQIFSRTVGLIFGLVIAALLSNILHFMGDSLFTTIFSMILYIIFGTMGYTIGRKRSREVEELTRRATIRGHRFHRKSLRKLKPAAKKAHGRVKVLDSSVLIDGRIVEVCRLGFLEGPLLVPAAVLEELRRVADSAEPLRRAKGRRGLDMVEQLKALSPGLTVQEQADDRDEETDVQLLRLTKKLGGAVVTGDYNLAKVARLSGVQVLNLNELAGAMRTAVSAGDELTVLIVKEGREPGQGVGYMSDGTMIVVDGGKAHMNENVKVTVTSALQTNAGRMVFARAA